MSQRKTQNIPRQLMLLVGMAGGATLAAAALYYYTSTQTFKDTSALATGTMVRLNCSYDLLERVSGDMNELQQLLRLDDPDAIEKEINKLETSQKQSATLIAGCGAAGAGVKLKFDGLVAEEKNVIDQFVKGQNALAYEAFLRHVSPQGSAVLEELRKYHETVQSASQQELTAQQNRMKTQLSWRLAALGLVLIFVLFAGWRLKNVIVRELLVIVADLVNISKSSANAASQVSSASQSLAEGAGEQAASLEETSSSLEAMSSVTQHNAETAQRANDLAKQANSAADKGMGDMQEMSAAMEAIKTSSDDIAKIIKTIDEIAFQTNILALNAAVEAARAGEAGMGFAVVADEVRNLAQRSAEAARETAAKIEGAISKTGQGVEISRKVSETLNEIVAKARRVDELVAEVAVASHEQTQGITQINAAIIQIDKVTQANAANAEESAAAAQELNAQEAAMKKSVAELLRLVGGDRQNGGSGNAAHLRDARETEWVAPVAGQRPQLHRNGGKQLAPATAKTPSSRDEIPLAGDFKNF
jgi:methyl-accepting chemotaxis protein